MSADKLVDSTQLNTDLTSVANAIRAKSGGSSQLAFPAGFVSEIQAIPSGGSADIKISGVQKATISLARATLSKNIVIDAPGVDLGISTFLANATATNDGTEIIINAKRAVGSTTGSTITTAIANMGQNSRNITKITFNTDDSPVAGSQFCYSTKIQRILGTPITANGLGGTGVYALFNTTTLVEFYVVPNKIEASGKVSTGVLIDASLVSLANGLKGALDTAQTITILNATTKAKCDAIMGTVSQATDGGETYDFFTQDASGAVTLTDFITSIKGWTLA